MKPREIRDRIVNARILAGGADPTPEAMALASLQDLAVEYFAQLEAMTAGKGDMRAFKSAAMNLKKAIGL